MHVRAQMAIKGAIKGVIKGAIKWQSRWQSATINCNHLHGDGLGRVQSVGRLAREHHGIRAVEHGIRYRWGGDGAVVSTCMLGAG